MSLCLKYVSLLLCLFSVLLSKNHVILLLCLFICSYVYHAVVRLPDVFVDGDTTDGIGDNVSGSRVLDVLDMSADVSFDGRILEHTVAHLVDGAVLQHEVLRIAEQLLAGEVTVH